MSALRASPGPTPGGPATPESPAARARAAGRLAVLLLIVAAAGTPAGAAAQAAGPAIPAPAARPELPSVRASFALGYHGQVVPWRQFLLRALPGEEVAVEVRPPADALGAPPGSSSRVPGGTYVLEASDGGVEPTGPRSWLWTAPGEPGLHRVVVRRTGVDSIALTAAVLVPLSDVRGGRVRDYRVGSYPDEIFRGLPRYRKPRGLIRVGPESADVPVSPHFRLGQFSVKRPATWPKYTVLHERLLLKAELLVERAARRGVPADAWRVLSGYRSPWYNRGIGRPRFSRHIFGDAADLYVDADGDGRMDDLTGDGRVDVLDADVLHAIVERMDADPALGPLLGGLGKYRTTPNHGPFIHLDTRGYRARW